MADVLHRYETSAQTGMKTIYRKEETDMTSISGIGSTMTMATHSRPRISAEQASQMAQNLFAKLDTAGQGYLTESELQSAVGAASSASTVSGTASVDTLFSSLDADCDGRVTESEFSILLSSLAQSASMGDGGLGAAGGPPGVGGPDGATAVGGMPPPPPPAGSDAGFTKEELTAQLSEIGSSDSKRSSLISSIVQNFDTADTDGDGKVSRAEAMAYDQSQLASSEGSGSASAGSTTDVVSTDRLLMRQLMRLMQAYGITPDGAAGGTSTVSATA
jgi:Ca2+-binding EF-hand superfamily protein